MSQIFRSVLRTTPRASLISRRPYHATTPRMAYKDSMDRESLHPGSTENTKTGRDEDIASENPDAAFNPDKTSPEAAKQSTQERAGSSENHTLNASGANQELSKPAGDENTKKKYGAGKETTKSGTSSGGGSPPKSGKPGSA